MELLRKRKSKAEEGNKTRALSIVLPWALYSKTCSRILLKLTKLLVQMDFHWNPVKGPSFIPRITWHYMNAGGRWTGRPWLASGSYSNKWLTNWPMGTRHPKPRCSFLPAPLTPIDYQGCIKVKAKWGSVYRTTVISLHGIKVTLLLWTGFVFSFTSRLGKSSIQTAQLWWLAWIQVFNPVHQGSKWNFTPTGSIIYNCPHLERREFSARLKIRCTVLWKPPSHQNYN